METDVAIDTSQSARNTAQSNQSIVNPPKHRRPINIFICLRPGGFYFFSCGLGGPVSIGLAGNCRFRTIAIRGRPVDIGADLCILHDMDLTAIPTPVIAFNALTASIWRSCRVAMRRNTAVRAHAHSKYMGSGSGLL
jgi:hypothetical protein